MMDKIRQIAAEVINEVEGAIIEGNSWIGYQIENHLDWRTLLTEQEYSRLEDLISSRIAEAMIKAMVVATDTTVNACNRLLEARGNNNGH
jgi:hypothetical protein